ncbi:MAG: glycosyltransferase family 4 protein [Gemmataceae bacterium]
MRVLHVTAGKLYGGIETYLTTLARHRHLSAMVPSFAVCFEGRLSDELRAAGVPVDSLGAVRFSRPWSVWVARRRFRELLRREKPEVVVCHECWPHALFAPVAKRAGVRLAFAAHDTHAGTHWVERWAGWTRPDVVLANSEVTRSTLGALFPGVPAEVAYLPVAPGAVGDRGEARRRARAALGASGDAVVVLMACRMAEWKGHAVLLDAVSRLAGVPGWECWIAGGAQRPEEQAYLAALRRKAAALEGSGRVRFLGQRDDVAELMAAADIHCQPNTGPEPFGVAFVEALYAGLPVVSTAIGGAKEIVDESCGVLVRPGDAAALSEALGRLIGDRDERARLGRGGPARAAALCDPVERLRRLVQILGSAAGCARGGGGWEV